MSRKKAAEAKVQFRMDLPVSLKEKLEKVSEQTGISMTQIVCMLIRFYVNRLDVERDVGRMLEQMSNKNAEVIKLTPGQKRKLADATGRSEFTKDLL